MPLSHCVFAFDVERTLIKNRAADCELLPTAAETIQGLLDQGAYVCLVSFCTDSDALEAVRVALVADSLYMPEAIDIFHPADDSQRPSDKNGYIAEGVAKIRRRGRTVTTVYYYDDDHTNVTNFEEAGPEYLPSIRRVGYCAPGRPLSGGQYSEAHLEHTMSLVRDPTGRNTPATPVTPKTPQLASLVELRSSTASGDDVPPPLSLGDSAAPRPIPALPSFMARRLERQARRLERQRSGTATAPPAAHSLFGESPPTDMDTSESPAKRPDSADSGTSAGSSMGSPGFGLRLSLDDE